MVIARRKSASEPKKESTETVIDRLLEANRGPLGYVQPCSCVNCWAKRWCPAPKMLSVYTCRSMTILQPVGSRPVDMSDDFVVAIVGPRCDPAMAAVGSWWRSAGTAAVEAETRRRRRYWRCRWQLEHRRSGGGRRTPPSSVACSL